jgi:hypothetical protein
MSMGSLLPFLEQTVRGVFSLEAGQCEVQPFGHPPPMADSVFIGLHDGGTSCWSGDEIWLGERYSVIISCMVRLGVMPTDMLGEFLKRTPKSEPFHQSLETMERKLKAKLHGNWLLMQEYNDQCAGTIDQGDKAILPLFWRTQATTWVYTDQYANQDPRGWLRRDLTFSGMDRQFLPESIA